MCYPGLLNECTHISDCALTSWSFDRISPYTQQRKAHTSFYLIRIFVLDHVRGERATSKPTLVSQKITYLVNWCATLDIHFVRIYFFYQGGLLFYQLVYSAGVVLFYHKCRQLIFTSSRIMKLWSKIIVQQSSSYLTIQHTASSCRSCKTQNWASHLKSQSQMYYLVKIQKSNNNYVAFQIIIKAKIFPFVRVFSDLRPYIIYNASLWILIKCVKLRFICVAYYWEYESPNESANAIGFSFFHMTGLGNIKTSNNQTAKTSIELHVSRVDLRFISMHPIKKKYSSNELYYIQYWF